MKVKESLSSSPPLLFPVAFLSFFQLENKKGNKGIGNKAENKNESSNFFGCKIFEALQQNEKFQILKKFPCFSVLLALVFLILKFLKTKQNKPQNEKKKQPNPKQKTQTTKKTQNSTTEVFLFIQPMRVIQEMRFCVTWHPRSLRVVCPTLIVVEWVFAHGLCAGTVPTLW